MIEMLTEKQRKILADAVADIETVLVSARRNNPLDKMSLLDKQQYFSLAEAGLTIFAYSLGYEITQGEGTNMQGKGHMAGSLHYSRLAEDECLFLKDKYITSSGDYEPLGIWWEKIVGGSWGGRFGAKNGLLGSDGNHFSISHGGKK